jgi:hypothetical protein
MSKKGDGTRKWGKNGEPTTSPPSVGASQSHFRHFKTLALNCFSELYKNLLLGCLHRVFIPKNRVKNKWQLLASKYSKNKK